MKVKRIEGFDGKYVVTDDGRVFNIEKGNEIVKHENKHGYYDVCLSCNGVKKTCRVHQLVFYTFNCKRSIVEMDVMVIDHIDGDKKNNNLSNLRRIPTRENTARSKQNSFGRGVTKYRNRFGVNIGIDGERFYLGSYDTPEEAQYVYLKAIENWEQKGIKPERKDRTIKRCGICGEIKNKSEFYYVKGHGYQYCCKECAKTYQRNRREK